MPGDKHLGAARDIIQFVERDEAAKQVLDTAFEIEGFARHAGTHAAGVVIRGGVRKPHPYVQRCARRRAILRL